MIIKIIERSLSREYNIMGQHEWKGARMVAEISETEDEYECGKELERKVEMQIASNVQPSGWISHPVAYDNVPTTLTTYPPAPPPTKDPKAIERLEILIDDATSTSHLDAIADAAEMHGLAKQWQEKMKAITSKYLIKQ